MEVAQPVEVVEEEIDEYKLAFEEIENSPNDSAVSLKVEELLNNKERTDDVAIKIKEKCIYKLARSHTELGKFENLMNLLKQSNDFFTIIPKAKTAKIVRNILTIVDSVPDSLDVQIILCRDVVEWCKTEKRTFLRQRIEAKLANLLLIKKSTHEALAIINDLLKELKKLDDKQMLTEGHLTESRIYQSLMNIPKAKASLTASRTAANAIYVTPLLQAELDEMSGVLHCEEGDYTTAYSYLLEAFDAYDQSNDKRAVLCLKYMILAKVLNETPGEVPAILSGKFGVKHAGPDIEAMAEIAKAARVRSLEDFKKTVKERDAYLTKDDLISHHLDLLYDKMLEANLLKIIFPFSSVEISHVSKLINLPVDVVEKKLSQMILDHRFSGILDQGKGHLIIYDTAPADNSFSTGVEIIQNIGLVVEALNVRATNRNTKVK